jgi:hypothetical protein
MGLFIDVVLYLTFVGLVITVPLAILTLGIMAILHLANGRLQKPGRGPDGPT